MGFNFSKLINDLCFNFYLAEIKIENKLQNNLSHNTSLYRKIICKQSGKHTISSIAKLLSIKTTAVTQKVNELESKNYVVRKHSDKDKRISYLYGVEQFCPCAEAIEKRNNYVLSKLQETYSSESVKNFLEMLEKTNEYFAEFDNNEEV